VLEITEIIKRIDEVKSSLENAFDNGVIDIDQIVKELETISPALSAIEEKLNAEALPASHKAILSVRTNHVIQMNVRAEEYR
jgi:hypothetical protein